MQNCRILKHGEFMRLTRMITIAVRTICIYRQKLLLASLKEVVYKYPAISREPEIDILYVCKELYQKDECATY